MAETIDGHHWFYTNSGDLYLAEGNRNNTYEIAERVNLPPSAGQLTFGNSSDNVIEIDGDGEWNGNLTSSGFIVATNIEEMAERIERIERILLLLGENLRECPLKTLIEELAWGPGEEKEEEHIDGSLFEL